MKKQTIDNITSLAIDVDKALLNFTFLRLCFRIRFDLFNLHKNEESAYRFLKHINETIDFLEVGSNQK